jgi:hypothetical protein
VSTFVDFAPTALTPFQFQPSLLNGTQYIVTVPWNEFGQRYYINVTDLSGNLVVYRGLSATGPTLAATLVWNEGIATATMVLPHNVPLASVANVRISQSGSGFDGVYQALSTDPMTLTYQLAVNPQEALPISGKVNFDLDLLAGYGIGSLYFHSDTNQFEF